MIQVICREETYIYNAYHMTKAFYPSAEVVSQIEEKASNYVTVIKDGIVVAVAAKEPGLDLRDTGRTDGREQKHLLDTILYRQLQAQTGRSLAWGILMGVRPTKLVMKKLGEGMEKADFVRWFMVDYLVSREKSELAWQIAVRERALLERLEDRKSVV